MSKGRFLFAALFALVAGVYANPVDMRLARQVGAKFINANTAMRVEPDHNLQLAVTYRLTNNEAAFHVFNMPKGFVIVSADDCATPILGYSEDGYFDAENVPPQMESYLQGFVEQIQYGVDGHLAADATIARQWELVKTTGSISEEKGAVSVRPLLTDIWNQNYPYNYLCPLDNSGPGGRAYAGCVATSFSQIMHYWSYPVTGTGSHTYTPKPFPTTQYPELTANFGETTYEWDNMPYGITPSSSSTQINAVATLMFHCGVAVDMMYGPYSSSAFSQDVGPALINYFGYSDKLAGVYKDDYSNDSWLRLIKGSLDLGRPVYYCGNNGLTGHAFVCDGYDENDFLHFNWGWSGSYNNYFALDALTPGNHNYNYDNYAIINIHPNCNAGTYYQVLASANPWYCGVVNGEGTYVYNDTCTLTASAFVGYSFVNWTMEGVEVSTDSTYSFVVTEDAVYVANFSLNSYEITVTANPEAGGTVSGGGTYNHGETVTLTAATHPGSTFINWTKNGIEVSIEATYSFTVTEAGDYVANFILDSYEVTVAADPADSGTVDGDGIYDHGTTATLTAVANEGYTFVNWTKNGTEVSAEAVYSFPVTEAGDYVANFSLNSYEVAVSVDPADGGTVTGAGTYDHGTTVTVEVVLNPNYSLENWTLNGTMVSEELQWTFVVTEDCELVAHLNFYDEVGEDGASALAVYPNPTKDKILLRGVVIQSVMVFNTTGQLVIAKEFDNVESIELDLGGFDSGVYMVAVRLTDGTVVNRLIMKY